MKTFALLSIAAAERVVQEDPEQFKNSATGTCAALIDSGDKCYIDGQDNSNNSGDCYCDEACWTTFNDCCPDMQYQCYNGIDELCPSVHKTFKGEDKGGCYTQEGRWYAAENNADQIQCNMTNDDCLSVSCAADSIDANFSANLFHTNLENDKSFAQQIRDGSRDLVINGQDKSGEENGPCGWSESADGIRVNWNYANCGVSPSMNSDNKIEYSLSVTSNGNAPGYQTIEFYVDTDATASCAYNPNVLVNADGFWVNQEDVDAFADNSGSLLDTFACKFYADDAYANQILDHNIVNMGEFIYGQVESDALAGLSYKLVGVTIFNSNNAGESFDVISGGTPNSAVSASSDGSASTGTSLNFSYLSFGFEANTGTNQNAIDIQCAIEVYIA